MKLVQRCSAVAGTALATLVLGAGVASAEPLPPGPVLPVVGDPVEVVETGLSTQEGCAYPGFLVIVVAQVSPDAVEGCGYFERDPASQG